MTTDAPLPGALVSDPRLIELRPRFRLRIGHVLAELEHQGWKPRISNAYRSAEEQRRKYELRFSKTPRLGFHGWGLAADIIDRRVGWPKRPGEWEFAARFGHALRDACDLHDVACGGWWRQSNPAWARHNLGWDPFHTWDHKAPREMKVEYLPEMREPW